MNERDEVNIWSGGALEYLGTIVKSSGELVREYDSISEASRDTGIPVCQISAARLGRQKTAHGFLWKAVGMEV